MAEAAMARREAAMNFIVFIGLVCLFYYYYLRKLLSFYTP